jgi:hypothetical protein
MTFTPKKLDKKTTETKRKKWENIKETKKKEYIPYPFEDYITNSMKEGESFDISKEEWFDHINEIRKNSKPKIIDEETKEHVGWNIMKVWKPYYKPVKKKKKKEEEKK